MKLLLDQMIDEDVAAALKAEGYDILRVTVFGMHEADDAEILNKAIELDRILVTLDEHFGDWTVLPICHHPGVIRIKAEPTSSEVILNILRPFLNKHLKASFENQLVIVKPPRVRWISTA